MQTAGERYVARSRHRGGRRQSTDNAPSSLQPLGVFCWPSYSIITSPFQQGCPIAPALCAVRRRTRGPRQVCAGGGGRPRGRGEHNTPYSRHTAHMPPGPTSAQPS